MKDKFDDLLKDSKYNNIRYFYRGANKFKKEMLIPILFWIYGRITPLSYWMCMG
jgi:hypothetical protein